MPRRRIHTPTDRAAHRLERAAEIIPELFDHLDKQRHNVTALRSPGDGPRGSGHADPTAITALVLDGVERRRCRITDAVDMVHRAIDELDDACRDALGHRVTADDLDEARPRCIGDGGPEGATCWNIPSDRRTASGQTIDDGRCHVCGPRHDARKAEASNARRARRYAAGVEEEVVK